MDRNYHHSDIRANSIGRNAVYPQWHCLAVVVLVVFAIGTISVFARDFFSSNNLRVSDVQIPIYLKTGTNHSEITSDVAAVVGFNSLKRDHQRIGFLRIGVLPLVVLDHLSFEVIDVKRLGEALAQTNHRLQGYVKPGAALEGREFELQFPNSNEHLSAKVVRFARDTWRLEDGSIVTAHSTCSFRSAVLQMSGPNAGELSCKTGVEIVRINLASPLANRSLKQ